MKRPARSYVTYSIGVGIAWAIVLIVVALIDPASTRHNVLLVFAGFAIGWLSATIARYVYPPPKKYRPTSQSGS